MNRYAQIRVVEAIVAIIIVFAAVGFSNRILCTLEEWGGRYSDELKAVGFNVLNSLAESGSLETLLGNNSISWERDLEIALITLLPTNTYFNLTVYAVQGNTVICLKPINREPITNLTPKSWSQLTTATTITYMYTGSGGIFALYLALGSR